MEMKERRSSTTTTAMGWRKLHSSGKELEDKAIPHAVVVTATMARSA